MTDPDPPGSRQQAGPLLLAACLLVALAPPAAHGQEGEPADPQAHLCPGPACGEPVLDGFAAGVQPLPGRNAVSVNPVALVVLGFFSVEYERVLRESTTWGASLSYYSPDEERYLSIDGKLRYYLQGPAFDGFSAGALVGFTSRGEEGVEAGGGTALGVGFTVEHQWLLGEDQRLALAAGLGGKRLFYLGSERGDRALPFIRASVGWIF